MRPFMKGFAEELVKLGAYGSGGPSGEWNTEHESPMPLHDGPMLHEQAVPPDVDLKNERADHFARKFHAPEDGKIVPHGQLGVLGKKRVS